MGHPQDLFVTAPRGLEAVLGQDLRLAGAADVRVERGGAVVAGDLELAYRLCLWSRVASRVLWPIASWQVADADALYGAVRQVDWSEHLARGATLAVDAVLVDSPLGHSQYAALRVKDAVVDQLRGVWGARPDIDRDRPDVRLNLYVRGEQAQLALDLAGDSLHRRGYRVAGAPAPLKETLAAAILYLVEWPEVAGEGRPLLDPMCGTGTFPIEAALMAADTAPGLLRTRFGLHGWRQHDPPTWERLVDEARRRDGRQRADLPRIHGWDGDAEAVAAARTNAVRAGVAPLLALERRDPADWRPPGQPPGGDARPGLVVTNPPYGKRLGDVERLEALYRTIGDLLKQRFAGWQAHILSGERRLDRAIGLRPTRRTVLFNGPIECRLLSFPLLEGSARRAAPSATPPTASTAGELDASAFANRLRKRVRHLQRWAAREGVTCYRVYDADLPEFALAVDRYEQWVHVQEYAPPAAVDPARARARLRAALGIIAEVLELPASHVFLKVRQRQRGRSQYERLRERGELTEVGEGGHRFLVNFTDYLDTGLFLDHRLTRARLADLAQGRDFLNLFAYTGTATVYAAKGGARSTTSVDLSRTYLDWAQRNLELNGIGGPRHRLERADCLSWLERAPGRYGLVFLDPPTFSTSKAMAGTFDVQRDHARVLQRVARLLTADGVLLFSTNHQRFRLDRAALAGLDVDDITTATLPPDFRRSPRIHRAFLIRRASL